MDRIAGQEHELEAHRERLRRLIHTLMRALVNPRLAARIDESGVNQEVMLKALPALREKRIGDLRPWLNTIAANTLKDAIRRIAREGRPGPSLNVASDESASRVEHWLIAEQPSPSELVIREEQEILLADAQLRLTEVERQVVDLCLRQRKPHAEVAAKVGRSVPAVRGLLTRAMKKLRDDLSGSGPSG